jgi:long-subunit fatty acid transport protein
VRVATSLRWTDSSTFGKSTFGFEAQPDVRPAFVPEANDEWRGALAVRFAMTERLEGRMGVAYSNRIVGTAGVSPMVFDNDHVWLSGGAGYELGSWTIDFMAGFVPDEAREVSATSGSMFPGKYETSGFAFMLGVQRRL